MGRRRFGPATQLIDRIYEEASKWAQPIAIKQVKFVKSILQGDAGLYGAGYLALTSMKIIAELNEIQ